MQMNRTIDFESQILALFDKLRPCQLTKQNYFLLRILNLPNFVPSLENSTNHITLIAAFFLAASSCNSFSICFSFSTVIFLSIGSSCNDEYTTVFFVQNKTFKLKKFVELFVLSDFGYFSLVHLPLISTQR